MPKVDSEIGIPIAEQPALAPHLAHLGGCAALGIVLVTVPRVSRSCEHFPIGFDPHLLHHPLQNARLRGECVVRRVWGARCRVQGVGFRVWGVGGRV